MDPPHILLIADIPHPPLISPNFATRDYLLLIQEHPIVEHQVNCGTNDTTPKKGRNDWIVLCEGMEFMSLDEF